MAKTTQIPLLYTSILYLCGFFLFLEWLYPLGEFTNINSLAIFIIYAFFCFLISIFNLRWWTTLLIKGLGLLFIIDTLFTNDPLYGDFSFQGLFIELSLNIQLIFTGNWYNITDTFRSILFLLLIWMISYLIFYWFIIMKRIFLFILLTFIYIALLDTFTLYDATFPIVRVFIISFIALGMANFFKEIHHQQIQFSWMRHTKLWIIPIVVVALFTSLIGYTAPKFDPQWPDPVPFLQGVTDYSDDNNKNDGINKSGYGDDDSQLGGSFLQDDSVVFHATTKHKEYWRIETKDIYTGKGWESTPSKNNYELDHTLTLFSGNVMTEDNQAFIEFKKTAAIDKLVYPYGLSLVEVLEGPELLMDPMTGVIQKQADNDHLNQGKYKLFYQKPQFDLDTLRLENDILDSKAIHDQYTRLPEATPRRIGDLAAEITASETNRYDQARAIEEYFGKSGFIYETNEVPFPAEDQDYVDQFLFETQAGYCDNYSTAMVVMLRTLDIPARWVKGFTGGEKIANTLEEDELFDIYEVTNANAHSWVEVYFPEIGWVPFEPTQGFVSPTDFVETSEDIEEHLEDEIPEEDLEVPEQDNTETENQEEQADLIEDVEVAEELNWLYIVVSIAVFILIGMIVYLTRFRWMPVLLYKKLKDRHDHDAYDQAYHYLLAQLRRQGMIKDPSQSLREYATYVDQKYSTNEMGILTSYYEHLLYNKQIKTIKDKEWMELWRDLIKQIQKSPREKG